MVVVVILVVVGVFVVAVIFMNVNVVVAYVTTIFTPNLVISIIIVSIIS